MAFDSPPGPDEWDRFHEYARLIKVIVFNLDHHQPFLHQMTQYLPTSSLFPNLKCFRWCSSTDTKHPPPSFFLSESVDCLEVSIHKDANVGNLFRNMTMASCNPQSVRADVQEDVPKSSVQLLIYILNILPWTHLTTIDITHICVDLPSDQDVIVSLSCLKYLTICRLFITGADYGEDVDRILPHYTEGFVSLRKLHVQWTGGRYLYRAVERLIGNIRSACLESVTMCLPSPPHHDSLPTTWIVNIFQVLSNHRILKLHVDYRHVKFEGNTSGSFRTGFLHPDALETLFKINSLHSLTFHNVETSWDGSLAFKMAKAWPYIQVIHFLSYSVSKPLSGLRSEPGNRLDIRDLIHFAKYSHQLCSINIPLYSMFQFEEDIPIQYKLDAKAERYIYLEDQAIYSFNNLATAAFLHRLFGRGVRVPLRKGYSLHRALGVYTETTELGGDGLTLRLDYNYWSGKGPDDALADDESLESYWQEK